MQRAERVYAVPSAGVTMSAKRKNAGQKSGKRTSGRKGASASAKQVRPAHDERRKTRNPAARKAAAKPAARKRPLPSDLRAHRGGVSPRLHAPAIRGAHKRRKAPKGAGKFPNFSYQGGPVIGMPDVRTSFWGALWSDAAHQARAQRLSQFHQDLLNSGFMNVLTQYGVGQGAGKSGSFAGSTFISDVPNTLTDPLIRQTIQSAIDRGAVPEPNDPSNTALVIYLDENIGIDDPGDQLILCEPTNDNAFGYHDFFTTTAGHKFYYAVIPGLSDTCLQESCPAADSTCSLHLAQTVEQRQTQVASHEFAEMTTDPELDAWVDPQNGENGDICNGESATITVGANSWTVQRTYSKTDDQATNGQSFCLATATTPIPPLKPGP